MLGEHRSSSGPGILSSLSFISLYLSFLVLSFFPVFSDIIVVLHPSASFTFTFMISSFCLSLYSFIFVTLLSFIFFIFLLSDSMCVVLFYPTSPLLSPSPSPWIISSYLYHLFSLSVFTFTFPYSDSIRSLLIPPFLWIWPLLHFKLSSMLLQSLTPLFLSFIHCP